MVTPKVTTLFKWIIGIILLLISIYLIVFLLKPKPLVDLLVKNLNIGPNLSSLSEADEETFLSPSTRLTGTIYHYNRSALTTNGRLLVDIPGGAFMRASNTLAPYQEMGDLQMPIVSISYPVLFEANAKVAFRYIMDALRHIITSYSTTLHAANDTALLDLTIVGCSAGGYYAVLAVNSNELTALVSKVVIVSGYFGEELTSNQLFKLAHRTYLTPWSAAEFRCFPMPASVDVLLISSTEDFLLDSTTNFSRMSRLTPNIYTGGHSLFWTPQLAEAQRMYRDIYNFIMNFDPAEATLRKVNGLCKPLLANNHRPARTMIENIILDHCRHMKRKTTVSIATNSDED